MSTTSNTYKTINVGGIIGGIRPGFFEVVVYSEEIEIEKALETLQCNPRETTARRTVECRLIMNPFAAKSIAEWLLTNVQEYESKFGEITMENFDEKSTLELEPTQEDVSIYD